MTGGYAPRPIRPLGLHEFGDWRIKVYSIASDDEVAEDRLVATALAQAARSLEVPTANKHYGVGFLGIHDGCGENQVFLDRWVNENELLHQYWISTKGAPESLYVPNQDHNSVCVWDLFVQSYEREAWLKHVLRAANPNIEAYLADQFLGNV
jgi:hypothetical protein